MDKNKSEGHIPCLTVWIMGKSKGKNFSGHTILYSNFSNSQLFKYLSFGEKKNKQIEPDQKKKYY